MVFPQQQEGMDKAVEATGVDLVATACLAVMPHV